MAPRTKQEIENAAKAMDAEAQILLEGLRARIESMQRDYVNSKGITDAAIVQARGTRKAVADAVTVLAQNPPLELEAEAHVKAASTSLEQARDLSARATARGNPLDEWKECRASVDRFDKLIVELRRWGFTSLTAIVTGTALFQTQSPSQGQGTVPALSAEGAAQFKLGAFAVIAILVLVLNGMDRIHVAWLGAAVRPAIELEQKKLDFELTQRIDRRTSLRFANWVSAVVYLVFLACAGIVFWLSTAPQYQHFVLGGGALAALLLLVTNGVLRAR